MQDSLLVRLVICQSVKERARSGKLRKFIKRKCILLRESIGLSKDGYSRDARLKEACSPEGRGEEGSVGAALTRAALLEHKMLTVRKPVAVLWCFP